MASMRFVLPQPLGPAMNVSPFPGSMVLSSRFLIWIRRSFSQYMGDPFIVRETLIKSLSDYTLEFLGIARNNLTRIASYLRKAMTKLCIKILVESDSAI